MTFFARVYPNGEFGIGNTEREEVRSILESTNASKSHREIAERAPRGSNGISSYGRRMVRNAAYLLEHRYGKELLGFLTLTLPPMTLEENDRICDEWSQIVRIAMQGIRRRLRAAGLPGELVGCVEIQPKRKAREGGMPLHIHLVFQAKKTRWEKGYPVSHTEYREIWKSAVVSRVPEFRFKLWNASENVKQVKKSAEAYLGKYLSKGVGDLQDFKDSGSQKKLPSAWWICSNSLKKAIKENTRYGAEEAVLLFKWMSYQGRLSPIEYAAPVEIESEGRKTIIAWYGKVSNRHWPRQAIGLNPCGSYEWSHDEPEEIATERNYPPFIKRTYRLKVCGGIVRAWKSSPEPISPTTSVINRANPFLCSEGVNASGVKIEASESMNKNVDWKKLAVAGKLGA